jgi:hypothetical protein
MSNTNNNSTKLRNVISISAQIEQIALLGTCELIPSSCTQQTTFNNVEVSHSGTLNSGWHQVVRTLTNCPFPLRIQHLNQPFITEKAKIKVL